MRRALAMIGLILIIAGVGFGIGRLFGLGTYGGAIAMLVASIVFWLERSLTAGTLKFDIKTTLESEAKDTLRMRTSLTPLTAVVVILGFTMAVVVTVVIVWWIAVLSTT